MNPLHYIIALYCSSCNAKVLSRNDDNLYLFTIRYINYSHLSKPTMVKQVIAFYIVNKYSNID